VAERSLAPDREQTCKVVGSIPCRPYQPFFNPEKNQQGILSQDIVIYIDHRLQWCDSHKDDDCALKLDESILQKNYY